MKILIEKQLTIYLTEENVLTTSVLKSVDYKFLISQLLLILIKNVTDIILPVMSWVAFIFLSVISHRLHYGHIPVQIQQLRQKSKVSKRSAFFIFDLE